jgi:hypothetical protein
MTQDKLIKKLSKLLKKTCFVHPVSADNLSLTLQELLENYSTLLKNELPEVYDNLVVIVDLDNIED